MEAIGSNNSGKNIGFMIFNPINRICQHAAAANKANVTHRLVKRLISWIFTSSSDIH